MNTLDYNVNLFWENVNDLRIANGQTWVEITGPSLSSKPYSTKAAPTFTKIMSIADNLGVDFRILFEEFNDTAKKPHLWAVMVGKLYYATTIDGRPQFVVDALKDERFIRLFRTQEEALDVAMDLPDSKVIVWE